MPPFPLRPRRAVPILLSLIAVLSLPGPSPRANTLGSGEAGPPFTAPGAAFQMEPGWDTRPVVHEEQGGRADLVVSLDQHLYPAFAVDIREYARERGLEIIVQEGTCGVSAGLLARKAVDIAGFCCPPGRADRLPGLRFHTVGIGALAIFVHPDNPVRDITFEQAQRIFTGTIFRWSELTAAPRPAADLTIRAVARLHCKARPGHWRLLLDNEDLFSPRLLEVGAIPDVFAKVLANPMSIGGFETLFMARQGYPAAARLRPLRIDGYDPAVAADVAANRYPLYFTFNLTSWDGAETASPEAEALVAYLLKQAERLDPEYGIIPTARLKEARWQLAGDELVGEPPRPPPASAR